MNYHLTLNLHGDTPTTMGIEANNIAQQVRALKLNLSKSCLFHGRNHSFNNEVVKQNNELLMKYMTSLSEMEMQFNSIYEACADIVTSK